MENLESTLSMVDLGSVLLHVTTFFIFVIGVMSQGNKTETPQVAYVEKFLPELIIRKYNCSCTLQHWIKRSHWKLLHDTDPIYMVVQ